MTGKSIIRYVVGGKGWGWDDLSQVNEIFGRRAGYVMLMLETLITSCAGMISTKILITYQ